MKDRFRRLSAILLLALSPTLLGGTPLKLSIDKVLPRGDGSPGVVTFHHESHVDAARPDCTTCHPVLYSIVKRTASSAAPAILHADMEKGRSCGFCHDGKKAHGLDDCETCHQSK